MEINKLRYVGGKATLIKDYDLLSYFPSHDLYCEAFCGGGSVFLSKPPAQYNYINDSNLNVYYAFLHIKNHADRLVEMVSQIIKHDYFVKVLRKKQYPKNSLRSTAKWLFLNACTYLGMGETLNFGFGNDKKILKENIIKIYNIIKDDSFDFSCKDFRKFYKGFKIRKDEGMTRELNRIFMYNDSPYLGTSTKQYNCTWTEQDAADLFRLNVEAGWKFAISEFDHPFVLEQAKKYNLFVNYIGERQNLKDRRNEILITNYEVKKDLQQKMF